VYVGYEGPLPRTRRKRIKTDITIREVLVFELEDLPVLRGYDEYTDLPEDALVRVYSLKEIATEKVVALLDPARNEPRDLYDIWFLVERSLVDLSDLVPAIESKLSFRERELAAVLGNFLAKEGRYRGRWENRLSDQMTQLPEFDGVYRAVRRAMRQAGLL
jgi:predicted nucleotidyltransferase component of viral defense system